MNGAVGKFDLHGAVAHLLTIAPLFVYARTTRQQFGKRDQLILTFCICTLQLASLQSLFCVVSQLRSTATIANLTYTFAPCVKGKIQKKICVLLLYYYGFCPPVAKAAMVVRKYHQHVYYVKKWDKQSNSPNDA